MRASDAHPRRGTPLHPGARALLAAALGLWLSGACAGPLSDPEHFVYLLDDGGVASDASDAGSADDAGDAGAADSGPADAAQSDAGEADAGEADAGEEDAGESDGGALADAGQIDAGHADAGSADAGAGADAGTVDAGVACDPVKKFFGPTCATGLCHGADTQQAGLDLESPGMPGRLVGQPGFGGPGFIIDPAQPDSSLLYTKVTDEPPFNFQMPLGLDPLSEADQECIRDWVRAAAAR